MEIILKNKDIRDCSWGHIFNILHDAENEAQSAKIAKIKQETLQITTCSYALENSPDIQYAKNRKIFSMNDYLSVEPREFLNFVFTAILRRPIDEGALNYYNKGKDEWWKRVITVIEIMSSPEAALRKTKLKNHFLWKIVYYGIIGYKKLYFVVNKHSNPSY